MTFPNAALPRRAATALLFTSLLCVTLAPNVRAATPAAPSDFQAQYRDVLTSMKAPTTTGILITEIGPDSAAGKAGAHGGDIITSYAGRNITDLKSLREAVAEVLASREVEKTDHKLLLGVRRNTDDVILQIEPAPLGIRAIEVEVGVPAPLNPPPSLRGSITLSWNQVASHPPENPDYLRTTETANNAWLGSIRRSFSFEGDALSGEIRVTHIDPGDAPGTGVVASTESITFHLTTGDYKTTPPFYLDSLSVIADGDSQKITTTAERAGPTLRRTTEIAMAERNYGQAKSETPFPPEAILQPLVPIVAAALPHEKDAVLPLTLTSIRDFLSRPGYVLASRGSENMPNSSTAAWHVDLMHCGLVVEKYWFDDKRELLRIDIASGTPITSTHAGSQDAAELPLTQKPAATQK